MNLQVQLNTFTTLIALMSRSCSVNSMARLSGGKMPFEAVLICKILPSLPLWKSLSTTAAKPRRRRNHGRIHFAHNAVNTTYKCAVKPHLHTHNHALIDTWWTSTWRLEFSKTVLILEQTHTYIHTHTHTHKHTQSVLSTVPDCLLWIKVSQSDHTDIF